MGTQGTMGAIGQPRTKVPPRGIFSYLSIAIGAILELYMTTWSLTSTTSASSVAASVAPGESGHFSTMVE